MTSDKPIVFPFTDYPITPSICPEATARHNRDKAEQRAGMIESLRRVFVFQNPPATYAKILAMLAELGVDKQEYGNWNKEG